MYDEIKQLVNILSFIIIVLGLIGYSNSRKNNLSGNSRATGTTNPGDWDKTGYNTYTKTEPSQNIKPNIIKQLGYSFIPHRYEKLAAVKTGSMIGFVTLLCLVSTLCIFAGFIITFMVRGGADAFLDWVPEFELQNGILSLEDDYFVRDTGYAYVYLTDQIDGFGQDDIDYIIEQGYSRAILGGNERMVLITNREYVERYYTEFGEDLYLNRKIVVEKLMPLLWVVFGIISLIFFVGRTFWYFGCASLYFLGALLITILFRRKIPVGTLFRVALDAAAMEQSVNPRKIPAGTLFRVAVYAKVPMFVVTTFWTAPYLPGVFRITITAGFMVFAIGHLLNQQEIQKLKS